MENTTKWEWEWFTIPFYSDLKGGEVDTEFIRLKRDWKFKKIHLYYSLSKEIKHKIVA